MYQVRDLQDAINAIQDLFERTETDKKHFDAQLTKAIEILDTIEHTAGDECESCRWVKSAARQAVVELA